jgi:hypothetical protein
VAAVGGLIAMSIEGWIQRWKLAQVFYNWQTLIAGVLAFAAGFGTVVATMIIARRQIDAARVEADREIAASKEQTAVAEKQIETTVRLERERVASEIEAIHIALAEEIWWLLRHLLDTHDALKKLSAQVSGLAAREVRYFLSLREAAIYPAIADKIGFIPKLAPYVVAFYGNIEHIRSAVRIATADPAETLTAKKLDDLAELFQQAFQENALPLLNQLPEDMRGLKERVEAMGPAPATTPPPSGRGLGGGG